jgi:hypothetical protein
MVRTRVHLPVDVFLDQRYLGCFQTRDIDLEGAFVEMPVADLKPNYIVRLVFPFSTGRRRSFSLLAGAVRTASDGVGLILLDSENVVLDILRVVAAREMPAAS